MGTREVRNNQRQRRHKTLRCWCTPVASMSRFQRSTVKNTSLLFATKCAEPTDTA